MPSPNRISLQTTRFAWHNELHPHHCRLRAHRGTADHEQCHHVLSLLCSLASHLRPILPSWMHELRSRSANQPAEGLLAVPGPCARATQYIKALPLAQFPHSCARARTVASEVFTEAQSFADCKLHIRTRLLASAFSNFWKTP
ncbi:hypothetical protein BD311DRAFT_747767, partial [Dichomitus squalens]